MIVCDWSAERRFTRAPVLAASGDRSGPTVLIEGRRAPFGVLGLHSHQPRDYQAGDVDFVQSLANVLGDAVERLHRRRSLTAILILGLDHFKLVNDSLGHQIGDELIAAAAPRLRQAVRSSDTVARFGGDVFGILIDDISGEHEAIELAERIASVFTRPFVLDGSEHFVTTSIGISVAHGAELGEDLIANADAAMHRAEERGRARYELFDEPIRARAISRGGRDTTITEAIVAMSHALSLGIVAEGAETPAQVAELSQMGCDFVQGFHYSRPVPAAEITRMLQDGPAWA